MKHRSFIFSSKEIPKNFALDIVLAYQRILNYEIESTDKFCVFLCFKVFDGVKKKIIISLE